MSNTSKGDSTSSPTRAKAPRRAISIPRLVKVIDEYQDKLNLDSSHTIADLKVALKDEWFREAAG